MNPAPIELRAELEDRLFLRDVAVGRKRAALHQ
jgi:hypothetical protein